MIGAIALVSSYAINGYRINDLESEVNQNTASIGSLNTQSVQTQVSLAQIQVDLTYIKASVDRISK